MSWHPDSLAHHMCLCAFELRHYLPIQSPVWDGYHKLRLVWPPGSMSPPPAKEMGEWLAAIKEDSELLLSMDEWGEGLVECAREFKQEWLHSAE